MFNQEKIVLIITLALLLGFGLFLPGFARADNLLSLLQSVSIIGAVAVAMAVVVIGRGIDLTLVAMLVLPVAWILMQVQGGVDVFVATVLALALALVVGVCNGLLIAYAEVPPIFATIATGTIMYGAVQFFFVTTDVIPVPESLEWLPRFWSTGFWGIPKPVIYFALVAAIAWAFLKFTRPGRFIYAIGDNPIAARNTGLPVRQIIVMQYVLSALVGLVTGIVLAGTVNSANIRLFNSTMIYDVILVVVIGGIGLSGGKGRISSVLIGTALIGILLNGMTIMDLSYSVQNLIKATILLAAIAIDSAVNPRDEQVSQQGDI
ncbi:MAG TPA: ABC transporter permease [Terriglobales bacterium]|nr:ABC transporter permease [Terriglobales bacterium]